MLTDARTPLDRERIHGGEILVFRQMPAMLALVARARAMACEAFAPHAPPEAQRALDRGQFRTRAAALRRTFMRDPRVRTSFRAVIEALALDPAATYADRLILRLQPGGASHRGRRMRDLPAHRDTWGSNLMAQINLWGPVFPVEAGATMVIWPALFDRAVPNTSAEWNLERLREDPGRYPLLPECRAPLDDAAAVPVLIDPGDLLCFSGAHLHASRPNRTKRTRLSLDTRIVDRDDVRAGRGPANVDGRAPRVVHEWFRSVATGERLSPP
ncbi:MAG: phytanoyl-CoA dioxygenase family protein [Spirochaetaceae bacterium]|nr:phytanoyl-CoA dioxygenase family protein [Spirochaetaceae bacterium]